MENITKFKVLKKLPFSLNVNDIVNFDNKLGKTFNSVGIEIPINPNVEPEFFIEIVVDKFKTGDKVLFNNKIQTVLGYSNPTFRSIRKWIKLDNYSNLVDESKLSIPIEYWFINSSGKIHQSFKNIDLNVDIFRIKSSNYFHSKKEAQDRLSYINSLV